MPQFPKLSCSSSNLDVGAKFLGDSIMSDYTISYSRKEKLEQEESVLDKEVDKAKVIEKFNGVTLKQSLTELDDFVSDGTIRERVSTNFILYFITVVGSKFDLTLPIFKHWNKVFNECGYEVVNEHYYSSKYSENCISIIPVNIENLITNIIIHVLFMAVVGKALVLSLNNGRI